MLQLRQVLRRWAGLSLAPRLQMQWRPRRSTRVQQLLMLVLVLVLPAQQHPPVQT
jgi:hypothetical protein